MKYSLRSKSYFLEAWLCPTDRFQVESRGSVTPLPRFLCDPSRQDLLLPAQTTTQYRQFVLFWAKKTGKDVGLSFDSAASVIARDGKQAEDAHFLAQGVVGIADGVGGWKRLGIDSGLFASELIRACHSHCHTPLFLSDLSSDDESTAIPYSALLPIAQTSLRSVSSCGGSTLILCGLRGSELEVLNLGDSKAILVRVEDGKATVVLRTAPMQHNFNTPFQVSKPPSEFIKRTLIAGCDPEKANTMWKALSSKRLINDSFERAQIYTVGARTGDLLIVGSDGLWDNLYESEVISLLTSTSPTPLLAHKIARTAYDRSRSAHKTPFEDEAVATYGLHAWTGGKQDDITVVVGRVREVEIC